MRPSFTTRAAMAFALLAGMGMAGMGLAGMELAGMGLGALIVRPPSSPDVSVVQASTPSGPAPASRTEADRLVERGSPSGRAAAAAPFMAVVFARQSADIVARSDGTLTAMYVNLGDRLQAGDLIARTDSFSITQQLAVAQASLRSLHAEQRDAEVGLQEAEGRYGRRLRLAEAGLISSEDLASARLQVDKAAAMLEIARAHVAEQVARNNDIQRTLAHTVVTAAFSGIVAARYLDPGAAVRSGTPIVSLIRSEDLWVRFAVPEMQRARVSVGAAIAFHVEGRTPAIPGVVEHISPAFAAMSQDVLVEARLRVPAALREHVTPGESGLVSPVPAQRSSGMS